MLQVHNALPGNPAFDPHNEATLRECRSWALTADQVEMFFKLSTEYEEFPYSQFYQLPCAITGRLSDGRTAWDFRINAGATAIWTNGKEKRYFGCMAAACESLVLLMPDGMDPD